MYVSLDGLIIQCILCIVCVIAYIMNGNLQHIHAHYSTATGDDKLSYNFYAQYKNISPMKLDMFKHAMIESFRFMLMSCVLINTGVVNMHGGIQVFVCSVVFIQIAVVLYYQIVLPYIANRLILF